jgi:hypothetical protein
MPVFALLLLVVLTSGLRAAPLRFARAGETEGTAEMQLHALETWRTVVHNTPLPQGARLRTELSGRFEAEMDDGSVLRLTGSALAELSDYAQLSTGQQISLFSLDHGTVYFTGRPRARGSLAIAVPGAQITVRQRVRLRFEVTENWTQIAVLEGVALFETPTAQLDLREGQMARIEPGRAARFQLFREIPALENDDWSQKRDEAQEKSASAKHLPGVRFGGADLDLAGTWLQTDDFGIVWKPKVTETWAPFQNGTWRWYDEVGYTWIAAEEWGWTPYHYGRWLQHTSLGWVWVPGASAVFKPGDVYWMRAAGLALWGPLAPDELWTGSGPARQFAAVNTSAARFDPGQRELDPAVVFTRPKDLLSVAQFTVALPSPPLAGSRFDAVNAPLNSTGLGTMTFGAPAPQVPGASFEPRTAAVTAAAPIVPAPPRPSTTVVIDRPVYVEAEPVEIYFAVPVYSGVVVFNPTVADPKKKRNAAVDAVTPADAPHHLEKWITPPEHGKPGPSVPVEKPSAEY